MFFSAREQKVRDDTGLDDYDYDDPFLQLIYCN